MLPLTGHFETFGYLRYCPGKGLKIYTEFLNVTFRARQIKLTKQVNSRERQKKSRLNPENDQERTGKIFTNRNLERQSEGKLETLAFPFFRYTKIIEVLQTNDITSVDAE